MQPAGLHVRDDAHALHAVQRGFAHEAAVHDVRARGRDGFLFIEALEDVEQRVDGRAALDVRGKLPAFVAGGVHDAVELFRIDEEGAAGVGIGLAVELAAERAVRHALGGRADALASIEGDLKSAETKPIVALVGGP